MKRSDLIARVGVSGEGSTNPETNETLYEGGTCPACHKELLLKVDGDDKRHLSCESGCAEGDILAGFGLHAVALMEHVEYNIITAPPPNWKRDGNDRNDGCDGNDGNDGNTYTRFDTISARALQEKDLPPLVFVVDEVLPQGLSLLAAPSKYGKSWMSLDLCLSVAFGDDFLGYKTSKSGTLYLALEDGYRRLQGRMSDILKGKAAPDDFHLTTAALTIDAGLPQQISQFVKEHPETKLVVIDVLERVRGAVAKGAGAYALDYQNMTALKRIADESNICILVIHHTRKMRDESDVYNMISGTNGIMGASDTIWVLMKENREDTDAKLFMTGRDIEQQSLVLKMDWNAKRWQRIGTVEEQAAAQIREQYEGDPTVKTIKALLKESPAGFELKASEFFIEMGKQVGEYGTFTPSTLGRHFQEIAPQLLRNDGILHKFSRTAKEKKHGFSPRGAQWPIHDMPSPEDAQQAGYTLPSLPSLPSQPSLRSLPSPEDAQQVAQDTQVTHDINAQQTCMEVDIAQDNPQVADTQITCVTREPCVTCDDLSPRPTTREQAKALYSQGKKYKEIAEALGVEYKTVAKWKQRDKWEE